MKYNIIVSIFILVLCQAFCISGQGVLSLDEAVKEAVENNFQILLADNARQIAENNTSIFNTGQLPTASLNGGGNYNIDNTTANFQDGRTTTITGATSNAVNVSLDVAYTIYDGQARKYNIEQLKRQYELSDLQLRLSIENAIAQVMDQYYLISSLANNVNLIDSTIQVNLERLARAEAQYEFGQANKLAILNAQVDLNTDSINRMQAMNLLENAKHLLNQLMVNTDNVPYQVNTQIDDYSLLDRQVLFEEMIAQNTNRQLLDKQLQIGNIAIDLSKARRLPVVGANASYGFSNSNNNPASFLSSVQSNGLTLGLTARWNIFDGGATRVGIENAKLNLKGIELQEAELINELTFQFNTAWQNYQNAIEIHDARQQNLTIVEENYNRTQTQFDAGQITSVELRQAQLNFLNAQVQLNTSHFDIKRAEVALYLLCGMLLNE
ncbi:MAG: TolC family protein [Saprospiraceae bacterium]|nr:TolC family protein [Saprospiraceae bacterium]